MVSIYRRRGVRGASTCSKSLTLAALMALAVLGQPRPVQAANPALLRLLQVLRDKGSLSAQEYEDIRAVADQPDALTAPPTPVPAPAPPTPAPTPALQPPAVPTSVSAEVSKALTGKWYERISLRGYTQFRRQDVTSERGAVLEVPADRTVSPNESFGIRRGRFIFSGDISDHLSLYAQSDFNASTGAADFSLQMRDLYGDIFLNQAKTFRVRLGQSKVPYGWVNLQSSQNRAPLERPDALNSAVEGERDLGASLMWASSTARQRFRDLVAQGLKGSGDYGVAAVGLYSGQGLNRSDQNGKAHVLARASYPFKTASGQFLEVGVQGYRGRFVSPTQSLTSSGATFTPAQRADGVLDTRVAVSAVIYPQPFGLEAEWTFGTGPELTADLRAIESRSLHGGYVQVAHRGRTAAGTWYPFARWNYFDGARKFARNAPRNQVNELDFGVEFARWADVELTGVYTRTLRRTRTSTFPYALTRDANRVGLQVQWNY